MIISDNFNDLYLQLIRFVRDNGVVTKPRGFDCLDTFGLTFKLTNPINSLCTINERKLNYKFAIIEKFEYLTGISKPETICSYNKNYANFLNETGEFDGAYGPRIRRQFAYVYNLLKKDPDTRQAIININNESDKHDSKDIPCTISLQFLLRNRKLNLLVNMRSNDLLWGTPYDVNGFCFLLEAMSSFLEVEVGEYQQVNGSTHIYLERKDKLFDLIDKPITYNSNKNYDIDINYDTFLNNIDDFWHLESQIREKRFAQKDYTEMNKIPIFMKKYLEDLM